MLMVIILIVKDAIHRHNQKHLLYNISLDDIKGKANSSHTHSISNITNLQTNLNNIKTYVGSDGKLHFTNSAGADSVLPFNNEENSSELLIEKLHSTGNAGSNSGHGYFYIKNNKWTKFTFEKYYLRGGAIKVLDGDTTIYSSGGKSSTTVFTNTTIWDITPGNTITIDLYQWQPTVYGLGAYITNVRFY